MTTSDCPLAPGSISAALFPPVLCILKVKVFYDVFIDLRPRW